jgi:hypothetical protein
MTRKSLAWSVRQVCTMIDKNTITFDNPIQRPSEQWDIDDKTLLIDTILTLFMPDIVAKQIKGEKLNIYDIYDGKQRLTIIKSFLNDEWALTDIDSVKLESTGEEYNISGLKFSELPENVQEEIKGFTITFKIVEFEPNEGEDYQEEKMNELFYRWNNGKAMSREHLAFVSAPKTIREFVHKQITENPLFTNVGHFSVNDIKRSKREIVILQSIMLLTGLEYKSFSNRDIEEFFTVNTEIEEEVLTKLENIFVDIAEIFNHEHNKFASKVNIPAMVGVFNTCNDDNADSIENVQHAIAKYIKISKPGDKYRRYTGSGCQKKENVQGRINALIEICNNSLLAKAV